MSTKQKRLVCSFATGAFLATVPELARLIGSDSGMLGGLKFVLASFSLPGVIIGLIASAGRVHEVSEWVVVCGSFVFYVVLAYFGLWLINTRETNALRG